MELKRDNRTSIDDKCCENIDKNAYARDIRHLKKYVFWSTKDNSPSLWEHQQAAIKTLIAYLNSKEKAKEKSIGSALLKLPTGTGKSGIISVISRCLPGIKNVLILTPREALTSQLFDDVNYRFWNNIRLTDKQADTFTASAQEVGASIEEGLNFKLLPSDIGNINDKVFENSDGRNIIVGTHQALGQISRAANDKEHIQNSVCKGFFSLIKERFDLIIVDEGHYEPAISWSKQVRSLELPTILLSATPYRNDFKSFRVTNQFVFNYPYDDAIANRIIREVKVLPLSTPTGSEARSVLSAKEFVGSLAIEWPQIVKQVKEGNWLGEKKEPKIIIRGESFDSLCDLQIAIDRVFNTKSVLIHDKALKKSGLKRYTKASVAMKNNPDTVFWIHQNKLIEGIDDPCFVAVAIYELMSNGRQIVQQAGRATRFGNGNTEIPQIAWVMASKKNAERISTTWKRYLGYEMYAKENTAHIVTNEAAMPDRLLSYMPKYQYIDGDFRGRYDYESKVRSEHVQLPKVASIFSCSITGLLKDIYSGLMDSLLEQDRFQVSPIENMPDNSIGFSYYSWRNSPYLVDRFFSEWKLGFVIAVKVDDLLFVHDTEGLSFQPSDFDLVRAERSLMEKAFPEQEQNARLSRMSFSSLSMSRNALRSTAIHTHSFSETFTDLLDPTLVPLTAAGFVNGVGRYVGFTRSRLRDASDEYVAIPEYVEWVNALAKEITDNDAERSEVFDRYANVLGQMKGPATLPASIILDLSFEDVDSTESATFNLKSDTNYIDLCSDVDPNGNFTILIGDESILCNVTFNEKRQRYNISSERLNELFPLKAVGGKKQTSLLRKLNAAQSFRVLTSFENIVYSEGKFYNPRFQWVLDDGSQPILNFIEHSNALQNVESEKGEAFYDSSIDNWKIKSIFGIFNKECETRPRVGLSSNDPLVNEINSISIWICDDDSKEIADFIGIDEKAKRLVFVHAKVGKKSSTGSGFNVGALQDVGRQALASLAFTSLGEPSKTWTVERWGKEVQANKKALKGCGRVFLKPDSFDIAAVDSALKKACRDPSYEKEVWIVGANMIDLKKVREALGCSPLNNRLRQLLMHWDSMQTSCARANVRLKLFC